MIFRGAEQVLLTPGDFFDGESLLSEAACTRLSDAVNVKLQVCADMLIAVIIDDLEHLFLWSWSMTSTHQRRSVRRRGGRVA